MAGVKLSKARWVRLRCRLQGHPLDLAITYPDGRHEEYCACGQPRRPDFYMMPDGRQYMIGRGPEPGRR